METPKPADVVVNLKELPNTAAVSNSTYLLWRMPAYVGRLSICGGAVSIELTEEQWPSEEHQKNMEQTFGFKFIRHDRQG